MNKKSFLLGVLTGVALTIVCLLVLVLVRSVVSKIDPIQYLESPVSYENKEETSFKVFQVLSGSAALANELSNEEYKFYYGNTVLIVGKDFYDDQVIALTAPKRVGTYAYKNTEGRTMTVPVIDGREN